MSIIKNKIERSRITFEQRMHGQAINTQGLTHTAMNNFEKFGKEKYNTNDLAAELKLVEDDDVFEVLQEWIHWNGTVHPRTLANYWSKVKPYLHYRGIKLHPLDIKMELKFPHKIEEELYGITRDDIQMIFKDLKYKHRLIFTVQSSSLMRMGEVMQLKKKHLEIQTRDGVTLQNIIVHLPAHITKLKRSRTTFLSVEASKILRLWVKDLGEEDLLFTKQTVARHAVTTVEQVLRRALIKIGLDERYESNNLFKINTHSFRAYGITIISRKDENLAKKLSGQKGYLLQYDRITDEQKLEIYKKCENELIIDEHELQKATILKLQLENKEIQSGFTKEEILKTMGLSQLDLDKLIQSKQSIHHSAPYQLKSDRSIK